MESLVHPTASRREADLLIVFADLTLFTRTARGMADADLAAFCQELYERTATAVEASGGTVVKFMGDAAMIVFGRERADAGVACLLELKRSIDQWMKSLDRPCRLIVKVHAGTAILGMFGGGSIQRLDVIGTSVNQTARLESQGIALSAPAFRSLSPATRKLFKKHTPEISYIPLDERH